MSPTTTETVVQKYRVYIKATADAIWEAITSKEWSERYGYPGHNEYDLRPGGAFRAVMAPEVVAAGAPEIGVDGEVVEFDPPHRLVQTWRFLFNPEVEAEGFRRVTWEIVDENNDYCRLTVTHDVSDAPVTAAMLEGSDPLLHGGGGWNWILSTLKTELEAANR